MNTLISAPWTRLLGSSIHDPTVMEFLAQLHPRLLRATVTEHDVRYRVYPLDGLEFILSGERISDIHIHVEPSGTQRCWAGRLPLGLCRGMSQEQVRALLGNPASSRRVELGRNVIWIERWQVPEMELAATFDAQGRTLNVVTLSKADSSVTVRTDSQTDRSVPLTSPSARPGRPRHPYERWG